MDGVEIRRSSRARRWQLEARWGEPVLLVVPPRMARWEIEQVLGNRRRWIEKQRSRQVPRLGLDEFALSEGDGRCWARRLVTEIADAEADGSASPTGGSGSGPRGTLWGSCSSRRTLSFNWRLVLAPREVVDYEVVHELCHLRVANHSPAFWALLEQHRPRWRDQLAWLRLNGPELLAYRPAE